MVMMLRRSFRKATTKDRELAKTHQSEHNVVHLRRHHKKGPTVNFKESAAVGGEDKPKKKNFDYIVHSKRARKSLQGLARSTHGYEDC